MENYLIITKTAFQKFQLFSLILKGKILRKLYQNNQGFEIKKYQNTYLSQIYQWWSGKLEYSSKIEELLIGKITSRGEKTEKTVYVLKYQPCGAIESQISPLIIEFSPLGSCKEIGLIQ